MGGSRGSLLLGQSGGGVLAGSALQKCEGLFFVLTYPRGGREIVSRKRKDSVSGRVREKSSGLFCVAGKIFFLNSRKKSIYYLKRFRARISVFRAEQPNQRFSISLMMGSCKRELGITWDPPP